LWQSLSNRAEKETIMYAPMPKFEDLPNENLLKSFENTLKIVEQIRRIRAEKNIPQKVGLKLCVVGGERYEVCVIQKLCNLETIEYVSEKPIGSVSFIENNVEYCIPLENTINVEEELKRLNDELKYTEGFLQSVLQKLSNEKFVSGAPEQVVNNERKKQTDAETKIFMLKEQILNLNQYPIAQTEP